MIKLQWGIYELPVRLQWGELATPTEIEQREDTPDPVAVMIATAGTAAPINWDQRLW